MPGKRDQPPPRTGGSETEVLRGFLDYLREAVIAKVDGAPEPAVRTAMVPSGTTLLGLVRHLTFVERATFLGVKPRSWKATFHVPAGDSVADVVAGYREVVAASNEVLDGSVAEDVRWRLAHMVEETGRHAGHADIIRELIDGSTGR
ncbi:DinB family protein [Lentzea sp. NBRC 102530]|uniref:DinB family protein n=1 Tax=Lentzea sp. NBRC 102530 TaxID=3032201 RepID=UPI0024A0210F|nr:DinB family protein [Lentzea sp. NBRC 102530]GLY54905.1 mini-circle protein [Lentzea sp. NBRC 102530]